jgi:hypothetical protein
MKMSTDGYREQDELEEVSVCWNGESSSANETGRRICRLHPLLTLLRRPRTSMMSFVSKPTLRAAYKEYSLKAYSWMKEGLKWRPRRHQQSSSQIKQCRRDHLDTGSAIAIRKSCACSAIGLNPSRMLADREFDHQHLRQVNDALHQPYILPSPSIHRGLL